MRSAQAARASSSRSESWVCRGRHRRLKRFLRTTLFDAQRDQSASRSVLKMGNDPHQRVASELARGTKYSVNMRLSDGYAADCRSAQPRLAASRSGPMRVRKARVRIRGDGQSEDTISRISCIFGLEPRKLGQRSAKPSSRVSIPAVASVTSKSRDSEDQWQRFARPLSRDQLTSRRFHWRLAGAAQKPTAEGQRSV